MPYQASASRPEPLTPQDQAVRLDLDRTRRIDLPEAIYCAGKTTDQCVSIVQELLAPSATGPTGEDAVADAIIATRANAEQQAALAELAPDEAYGSTMIWRPRPASGRTIATVSAGTSDLDIAEECRLTLTALGHNTIPLTDVGVAGLHRLTSAIDQLDPADVIVAFAGMEGALPTVLAGLIAQPIVAVPTSVGYGTSFEGATALLSMMSSCAPGIAVVGIDNGYGAACAAHRIARAITPESA